MSTPEETARLLLKAGKSKPFHKLLFYKPYDYQQRFHAGLTKTGKLAKQRVLQAGNQLGKTECAAMEVAIHATGLYPEWWQGLRFEKPVLIIVGAKTYSNSKAIVQKKLLGAPLNFPGYGTGCLPKHLLASTSAQQGLPEGISVVRVKHKSGGQSEITFKAYDAGADTWVGVEANLVWLDEEPPLDIYSQSLRATATRNGNIMLTFTPEHGKTELIAGFEDNLLEDTQMILRATWWDCPHFDEARIQEMLAGYPAHQREMRSRGVAQLGEGLVFPVLRGQVSFDLGALQIGAHWPRICAIDFGWQHPTAIVWLAKNPASEVVYLFDCWKQAQALPVVVAEALKTRGGWIPVVWPKDGSKIETGTGKSIAQRYRQAGVRMLPEPFQNPGGGAGIEEGLWEMLQAFETGRFKVAAHLSAFFTEMERYNRVDGRPVAKNDDLISAARYAFQSLRFALVNEPRRNSLPAYAIGADEGEGGANTAWMN